MNEDFRQRRCATILADTITDVATGCMTRPFHNGNYQVISVLGQLTRAHRFIAFSMLLHSDKEREEHARSVVCHTCDNRACVNPAHLYIGTQEDNLKDAIDRGGYPTGQGSWSAKLTLEDVNRIRALGGQFSQRAIARQFGVSQQQISRILSGKKWARS